MRRDLQFGMRENPASDRRHGSRLALSARANETLIEQNCASPSHLKNDGHVTAISSDFAKAASLHAATEGERRNRLLTVHEVADLLHVPVSWVYGRMRRRTSDRLPAYRLGKYWRFEESAVLDWLSRQPR